jgi:hypothetical protein
MLYWTEYCTGIHDNIVWLMQVRGLLPGQQLVQMPDGKLQIFTNNHTAKVTSSPQQVPVPYLY